VAVGWASAATNRLPNKCELSPDGRVNNRRSPRGARHAAQGRCQQKKGPNENRIRDLMICSHLLYH
jgi:hypothetical protein